MQVIPTGKVSWEKACIRHAEYVISYYVQENGRIKSDSLKLTLMRHDLNQLSITRGIIISFSDNNMLSSKCIVYL